MSNPGKILLLCCAAAIAFVSLPLRAEENIPLGIVLDTNEPLRAVWVPEGEDKNALLWGGMGIIGGLIRGKISDRVNNDNAVKLRATVGEFPERDEIYRKSLIDRFTNIEKGFDLSFLDLNSGKGAAKASRYLAVARERGLPHLLVLEEFAGIATPVYKLGTMSQTTGVQAKLYDVKSGDVLFEDSVSALAPGGLPPEEATEDRARFISGYQLAVTTTVRFLHARMSGQDALHKMAKVHDLEDRFPSVQKILKQYARTFKFKPKRLRGWRKIKTNNDWFYATEPKKDFRSFGITSSIDLLIAELGQDVGSVQEYVDIYLGRLQRLGWDTQTTTLPEGIDIPEGWTAYRLKNPNGGISTVMHYQPEPGYVLTYEVIALGNTPDSLIEKYREDIQKYLAETTFTMK